MRRRSLPAKFQAMRTKVLGDVAAPARTGSTPLRARIPASIEVPSSMEVPARVR